MKEFMVVARESRQQEATITAANGFLTESNLMLFDKDGKGIARVTAQPGYEFREASCAEMSRTPTRE